MNLDPMVNERLRQTINTAIEEAVGRFFKDEISAQKKIQSQVRVNRTKKVTKKLIGNSWSEDYTLNVEHKITRSGREASVRVVGQPIWFRVVHDAPMWLSWGANSNPSWRVSVFEGRKALGYVPELVSNDYDALVQQVMVMALGGAYYEPVL